jgi:CheY-like chemotaxis protein
MMTQVAKTSFPEARFSLADSFSAAQHHLVSHAIKDHKLVLLDLDLAGAPDKLAFLRLLRNHPKGRLLPVVVVTSDKTNPFVTQAYELGASAFTQKPVNVDGWKNYLAVTRQYWYETVTLPDKNE